MARYERVAEIYDLLTTASEPIALESLCSTLDASSATVKRLVRFLREQLLVPVEFDREKRGYVVGKVARESPRPVGPAYDSRELSALLTAYDLLDQIPPGLFRKETAEARLRLKQLLYRRPTGRGELKDRVRLQMPQNRRIDEHRFQAVLTSLATEKRLKITYRSRTRQASQTRVVSPQRLTFYRSNWYLAAWCHVRSDLRVFALDRVITADLTPIPAHMLAAKTLDARLSTGYGIFEGEADAVAVLKFTAESARWVADEEWHPQQRQERLEDGGLLLHIPYRHATELSMDIQRYGAEVEVLSPPELRKLVADSLARAATQYA
jgi:predicted DNA-binding transcriptional regulator YafY